MLLNNFDKLETFQKPIRSKTVTNNGNEITVLIAATLIRQYAIAKLEGNMELVGQASYSRAYSKGTKFIHTVGQKF